MKTLKGIAKNLNKSIIGKITKKPLNRFARNNFILVTNEANNKLTGYLALITNRKHSDLNFKKIKKIPIIYDVNEIEYLNEGDVVSLDTEGNIYVFYRQGFDDNALLLTERCNCDCIMCPQERVPHEESRTSLNLKLISLMSKSTKHLGLTGGEPTLIGEDLLRIIDACKKHIPSAQIDVLTNGIRLSNFKFVKKIVLLQHPNIIFAIPLYADTDKAHNSIIQANGFYKTIQGIYNLALFNQRIEIRIVLHKLTYERLPRLAEFIYHNFPFVYHVALMGMETRNFAEKNIEKLWIDPYEYMPQLKDSVFYLYRRLINVSIYNLQLCILLKELHPFSVKTISAWKNIYLEECNECYLRNICGGFFESSIDKHSAYIKPIKMLKKSVS